MSRGGSNEEAFDGLAWGEVVQGGAGAPTRVLGRWRWGRAGAGGWGAFGSVLADQATCALVGASLPWPVGIGEVDRHIGGPGT